MGKKISIASKNLKSIGIKLRIEIDRLQCSADSRREKKLRIKNSTTFMLFIGIHRQAFCHPIWSLE